MKKIIRVSLIIFTILIAFIYCFSCLTPYFSPTHFPFLTIISIVYLPVLILYGITMIVWLFRNRKIFIILLLLLFAGYKNLLSTVAMNVSRTSWKWEKDSSNIRIMTWNVNTMGDPFVINDTANSTRQQILALIKQTNPDILCVQDLAEKRQTPDKRFVQNIETIMKTMGFASSYYPFYFEFEGYVHAKLGVAIFTKLPLIDTGSFLTTGSNKYERFAFADVMIHGKPVRIINAHLSSMSLWPSNKAQAGIKYLEGDSTEAKAKSIYSKIESYGKIHVQEAGVIKSFINKSPYPVIFTADLNSVPSSYVYNYLKTGLNDACLENDIGISGTYNRVFPKLRIDVMLHSPQIKVVQFVRPVNDLSDHYPLIADMTWTK